MKVKPLRAKFKRYLTDHQLNRKFEKQCNLFQINPRHPSLHTELLEPKSVGIYSFRVDKRYRALFIVLNQEAEIIDINDHYQ